MDDSTATLDPALDESSQPFVTRWNGLISTTNWEKGRIIHEWRERLIAEDAPPQESSDEAWSRRVGGVSGQHVGRLRRVYDRFGDVREQYEGLYWSHFQAALDWNDAEMWLEGAVQSGWSVSAMRSQRWEALGAPADQKPRDEDIVTGELDEDSLPPMDAASREVNSRGEEWPGPDLSQGADFGDEPDSDASPSTTLEAGPEARCTPTIRPSTRSARLRICRSCPRT